MRPKGRQPQGRMPVDFQEILPLNLKNKVSGKSDKLAHAACVQEMTTLFTCFKKHEFEQTKCADEIAKLQSCYKEYRHVEQVNQEQERTGTLVAGNPILNARQLNLFLKKFPHKV